MEALIRLAAKIREGEDNVDNTDVEKEATLGFKLAVYVQYGNIVRISNLYTTVVWC